MNNSDNFTGIFPAVVTPFSPGSSPDTRGLEKLTDHLYKNDVNGIFVGGNMGEWFTQTLEERKNIAERAVKLSAGRGKVILQVGSARFEDAIALVKYGEKIEVDAIGSLPPYNARFSEKEIVSYYRKLAAATRLPVFLYYHPALTGFQIGQDTIKMLETVPNIAGIKFTDYDLLTLFKLINLENKKLSVMIGHDQVLNPGLSIGASGGIGSFYNIIPKAFVTVYQLIKDGNLNEANSLQTEINKFIQFVKKFPLIPVFKYILKMNNIIYENFRLSNMPLTENDKVQLEKMLGENIFYNKWKITA